MLKIIEKKEIDGDYTNCVVCNFEAPDNTWEERLHKSEIELFMKLNGMQKALRLQPQTVNEIWSVIREYGCHKYEQGVNNYK